MTTDDSYLPSADLFDDGDLTDDRADPGTRSAPWYLGDACVPADEPTDRAGRAAMRAEFSHLPFTRTVRHLLDAIGDGMRLTRQGKLYAVDRRRVEERCAEEPTGRRWGPYGGGTGVELAWDVLTRLGWLLREEGRVRPSGKVLVGDERDDATEEALDDARQLLAAVLDTVDVGGATSWWGSSPPDDGFDALLVASGTDGLTLPVIPPDDRLIHCSETVDFLAALIRQPHIHHVPIDRATGHVAEGKLRELGHVSRAMSALDSKGLLVAPSHSGRAPDEDYRDRWDDGNYGNPGDYRDHRSLMTFRAPVMMRGAVAVLRERRAVQRAELAADLERL
ncbi:MAG: hypothetical protein ACTIMA_03120 [Brachybacterium tyrofermentans]|uniref:Uncharacterized protein n=1 Tax=Brachybacterium tyrofermentans TaxID=47848 RepID=A0ABW0FET9_9MICO|nr:hypothetical protein [Brachybacterium tyrofermentans]SLN05305.1 hypothetical protein FM103_19675 [Corynebacterium xerosis]